MFEWIASPEAWIALATLTVLEIVLGVDNIIFISILTGRLPEEKRDAAAKMGLGFALVTRLLLLFSISWIMGLTEPWFTVFNHTVSGRDLVLIVGGLFLLGKSTHEIHKSLEVPEETHASGGGGKADTMFSVILQIGILDIVFSLDSVITAVGLVDQVSIMIIAVILAMIVMLIAVKPIGTFVDQHPTVKMLALSFLMLIGFTLISDGAGIHIPKGYIYFAMAFSVLVEMLNLRVRSKKDVKHVELYKKM